jgi:hypothetical protein
MSTLTLPPKETHSASPGEKAEPVIGAISRKLFLISLELFG